MNQNELKNWILELIDKDELWKFYKSKQWMRLKDEVLRSAHYECYECRKQGKITRYDVDADGNKTLISTVHHVQFVRKHPELALSKTYVYRGKHYPNLIPVCKSCHNKLHKKTGLMSNAKNVNPDKFINEERW